MSNKSANDEDSDRVDNAAVRLLEHFDSVHIVCTRYNDGDEDTTIISRGKGNWHARYGSLIEAVDRMEEQAGPPHPTDED